jgi:hypothetical protein
MRAIMPTPASCRLAAAWTGGLLMLALSPNAARAQLGATPEAINGQQRNFGASCPLIVPASQAMFQPLRINPSVVAAKNRAGCLSSSDAIYGPDGCPLRFCATGQGVIPLPSNRNSAPLGSPQLPAP